MQEGIKITFRFLGIKDERILSFLFENGIVAIELLVANFNGFLDFILNLVHAAAQAVVNAG